MKEKRFYGICAAVLLAVGMTGCGSLSDTRKPQVTETLQPERVTDEQTKEDAEPVREGAEADVTKETEDFETQDSAEETASGAVSPETEEEAVSEAEYIALLRELPAGSIVDMSRISEEAAPTLFYAEHISETVFARIDGCSYRENENISLDELRYMRVLYMGFDGETHIGELIVNGKISTDILDIMQALYYAAYPIEQMVLVDAYGGDDDLSMAANNTSAFNYRNVPGTGRLSNHSYGLAIDINPLYNPYIRTASDGSVRCDPPEGEAFADRKQDFPYKIDHEDLCYKLFAAHGFQWGGDWKSVKDYQHFEKTQ